MSYHKDGFIHSIPDEVIDDIATVLEYVRDGITPDLFLSGAAQRLEKYVQDYKKYNSND